MTGRESPRGASRRFWWVMASTEAHGMGKFSKPVRDGFLLILMNWTVVVYGGRKSPSEQLTGSIICADKANNDLGGPLAQMVQGPSHQH